VQPRHARAHSTHRRLHATFAAPGD
jgi:hypothetical protein